MDYFNADGGPAALCINGTRCAARLAAHLGWSEKALTIRTGAGDLAGSIVDATMVALQLPRPGTPPELRRLRAQDRDWEGFLVSVGVPHFVLDWTEPIGEAPVARVGPALRGHPDLGPGGANVDFVRVVSHHHLEIRSFERGVEAETLACGTGVLAAVAVGLAGDQLELPVEALTRGGFTMTVSVGDDETRWNMAGDARLLARLEVFEDAMALPRPTGWGESMG